MLQPLWKLLDVEEGEEGRVGILLLISFVMGTFLATVAVASQTIFLSNFDEKYDLPRALGISGVLGMIFTLLYNFMQGRVSFVTLANINLIGITLLTAFIEFGDDLKAIDSTLLHGFAFTLILPFTYLTQLIFWGAFGRMFNTRDSKRIIGSIDVGMDISQILGFFLIPVMLNFGISITTLFSISLMMIVTYFVLFQILAKRYLKSSSESVMAEKALKKLSFPQFFKTRYIGSLSLYIIISLIAASFIDFSYYNVTVNQFTEDALPYFLSLFEGTIVVFSFLFTTFATDKINKDYGIRVGMLVTPVVVLVFCVVALILGAVFGYDIAVIGKNDMVWFFLGVAMCKLLVASMTNAVDQPTFKLFYVPIDRTHKIDVQTKVEGFIMALGATVAGALIVTFNQFNFFNLLAVIFISIPLLGLWIWTVYRMHKGYVNTLTESLNRNKSTTTNKLGRSYSIKNMLLEKIKENKKQPVMYSLKVMEQMDIELFERTLQELKSNPDKVITHYVQEKSRQWQLDVPTPMLELAKQAQREAETGNALSVSVDKINRLAKSPSPDDRRLAAKLMRNLTHTRTVFTLLELLRDHHPSVRVEAIITARHIQRPETWPILIDLIAIPQYANYAVTALKSAGNPVLPFLDHAFHKTGQQAAVMMKIIEIIGAIGTKEAMHMLWSKFDYPDKRILQNILLSLRITQFQATGRQAIILNDLLEIEMGKTLWNLATIEEIPENKHYALLLEAMHEEVQENYEQIHLLLSLLYDANSMQLIRDNLDAATPDSIQYAVELMDLLLSQGLKEKLIPLLDDTPVSEKLETLITFFPREKHEHLETIQYIMNRDFNSINRWTKVCAIMSRVHSRDMDLGNSLISHVFNEDKMLQEAAGWLLYNKDRELYESVTLRLPYATKRFLDESVHQNQLTDGLDDGYFMIFEVVLVLKQIPAFKSIRSRFLTYLADAIHPITIKRGMRLDVSNHRTNPIIICALGQVQIEFLNQPNQLLNRYDVFGDLFQDEEHDKVTHIEAKENAVIFKIEAADFYYILANQPELTQGILNTLTINDSL